MTKFWRRFKYALFGLLFILFVVVGGAGWLFYGSLPDLNGRVELKGLSGKVSVYRDMYGVPHIFADNRSDALRALGYLHASERFFQMEMQRRAGQGRLAEVVGIDMLGVDKFIRTLGLYSLAGSSFKVMAPETQNLFQAYADGVNAWMETHRNNLPPEFLLLGIDPEPWQPADSVVWGKLMALQLSHNYQLEMLRAQLATKLSPSQMKSLFPAWGDAPVTMEPKAVKRAEIDRKFLNEAHALSTSVIPAQAGIQADAPIDQIKHANGQMLPIVPLDSGLRRNDPDGAHNIFRQLSSITSLDHAASNEWVIAGSRTQSGKPILANDPHLSLEAPILWYLARIVTPDFMVKGATVPGLPVVLLGQNRNIAWGMTTTGSDVQDLFVETIDPKNPANYLTPSGSRPFDTHKELIHIKGREGIVLTIRATRHGPVLSDIDPEMALLAGHGKVMALAFTGLGDTDRTAEALLRINQANNWKEFLEALKLYQSPTQNVVFADIKGDIGFINPGLVPVRKKGDGLMPVDGTSGIYDWQGTVPFEEWPKLYNPAVGFVFNANNAVVSAGGKNFYGTDWEEPYRAIRLQQFLDSSEPQTLDSSAEMQADHVSLVARQLLPYLLRLSFDSMGDKDNQRSVEAIDLLRDWDGTMDKNLPQPLIFEAWLAKTHQLLLVDRAGQSLKERGPFAANSIAAILINNDKDWCGNEGCVSVASKALVQSLDGLTVRQGGDMKRWRWGKEHKALLQNKVFKHLPIFGAISDLSVPSSGDFYTLDRGGSFDPPAEYPFARQHGGGYRAIYDLANPDHSRFMITTGESGNIASSYYGNLVHLWNNVKAITLSGTQTEFEGQNSSMLEFTP